ncbi:AP-4 complex subunit epsilon-like protein [Corchorus olitorius]|uniref:AP-4 complex subunit epsilon-like protein n=1 Tax=Corchorus olitorius TaxID=93759 RepID=A0A1R3KMY2_9ROSI|nr:AP-4 complex subunit epsilon-like protein [Corchorus olitorius]
MVGKANGKHYKVLVSIFNEPPTPDYRSFSQQEFSDSSSSNNDSVSKWAELDSKNDLNDASTEIMAYQFNERKN